MGKQRTRRSIDVHLACFQFLPMMNRTAIDMDEQLSQMKDGESFGEMPQTGIAGSSGRSIPASQGTATPISIVAVQFCTPTSHK